MEPEKIILIAGGFVLGQFIYRALFHGMVSRMMNRIKNRLLHRPYRDAIRDELAEMDFAALEQRVIASMEQVQQEPLNLSPLSQSMENASEALESMGLALRSSAADVGRLTDAFRRVGVEVGEDPAFVRVPDAYAPGQDVVTHVQSGRQVRVPNLRTLVERAYGGTATGRISASGEQKAKKEVRVEPPRPPDMDFSKMQRSIRVRRDD